MAFGSRRIDPRNKLSRWIEKDLESEDSMGRACSSTLIRPVRNRMYGGGGVGGSPGQPGLYPDPMVRRFVHARRSITSLVNQTRVRQRLSGR